MDGGKPEFCKIRILVLQQLTEKLQDIRETLHLGSRNGCMPIRMETPFRQGLDAAGDVPGDELHGRKRQMVAGNRNPDDSFHLMGKSAFFWSSDEYSKVSTWGRFMEHDQSQIVRNPLPKIIGISIRCIKDDPDL